MKVWYLHGLESDPGGPKVDFLNEVADEVFAPAMDYRNHKAFGELYRKVTKEGKPDLIIGSSMGGYFADSNDLGLCFIVIFVISVIWFGYGW